MFSRLSLTKKVLLLVAIPLFLELGFLGALTTVMGQVEHERKAEAHAADLSAGLNVFLRMTMEALVTYIMVYFSKEHGVYQRSERVSLGLHGQLDAVEGIMQGHPEELAVLARMKTQAKALETYGRRARDQMKDGNRLAALQSWADFKETFDDVIALANKIIAEQTVVQQERREAVEMYRKRAEQLVAFGVLFNFVVAFGMVIAFNRSLLHRLRVLSDNTVRVASGRQLHPAVKGNDEIARLDEFFHQMVRSLEEAREKEKEIEQMKRDFVAMVSHDLRTPLASIQMFHSALLEGVYGDISKRGRENLELIELEVDRLIRLVNDLLNIEKLESGKLELEVAEMPINGMLKRSADAVVHLADGKQVKIAVHSAEQNVDVDIDEERMVQVMINLLGNAIKFAEVGSTIEVGAVVDDAQVEVLISDRNRTIPAELRTSIFERFKQVDRSDSRNNKGTGLGLAICKAIAERHGGTIGVREREGGGNVFWFTVPRSGVNVSLSTPGEYVTQTEKMGA